MQRLRPSIVGGMAASALSVLVAAVPPPVVITEGERFPPMPSFRDRSPPLTKREKAEAAIARSAKQERKRKARKAQRAARRRNRS